MRDYLAIVFILLCMLASAKETETGEEIWIDGRSFYKSAKNQKKTTLYFSKWTSDLHSFLKDAHYYVAIQLTDNFDPIPDDGQSFPSLKTLSAVADEKLKEDYFQFLESFGRTHGVNHMVLPDTATLTSLEKETLDHANRYSPFYFVQKSTLTYGLPNSRKDFKSKTDSDTIIWVAEHHASIDKIGKWKGKSKHVKSSFYTGLHRSKRAKYVPAYSLPESLSELIFEHSIIAIDSDRRLPLREHVVSYLGADEKLKNRLSQYVKLLDYRKKGVACIVDLRNYEIATEERDVIIQYDHVPESNTALLVPETPTLTEDIIIGKMLFGSQAIVGRSEYEGNREVKNMHYLGYSDPEIEGMNAEHFRWVDSLASDAIKKHATPGMQLAVVKNGQLVMNKSYGFYTYDSLRPVKKDTRYDIASVTKVVATLPAVALLIDQGKIHLDDSISTYLPQFTGSNKSHVTIRQLLAHQAGLKSYVPFWSMMMGGDRLDAFYYKTPADEANDIRTYGLEPHPHMLDSLKSFIIDSRLIKNTKKYHYSDLGFMILHLLVEKVSGSSLDKFLSENFYQPMGINHTYFNPKQKEVSLEDIAPTEYDLRYRNYQVWGEVHDRNALVFGGVAGHAGLFSTASDLAKIMSMFLNDGYYGGKQYISKATLDQLNIRHFRSNRRGLGWDKRGKKNMVASVAASDQSFGHTGFTGTMVWADPQKDLIYVFLSNRIYPNADNWTLGNLHTRTNIHDVLYQALKKTN